MQTENPFRSLCFVDLILTVMEFYGGTIHSVDTSSSAMSFSELISKLMKQYFARFYNQEIHYLFPTAKLIGLSQRELLILSCYTRNTFWSATMMLPVLSQPQIATNVIQHPRIKGRITKLVLPQETSLFMLQTIIENWNHLVEVVLPFSFSFPVTKIDQDRMQIISTALNHMKNLKHLDLNTLPVQILQHLFLQLKPSTVQQLHSLRIHLIANPRLNERAITPFETEEFSLLFSQLRILKIGLLRLDFPWTNSHFCTLQVLILRTDALQSAFPKMNTVKLLDLSCEVAPLNLFQLVCDSFPSIQYLRLQASNYEMAHDLNKLVPILPNLNYLELRLAVLHEEALLQCSSLLQSIVLQCFIPTSFVYKLLQKLKQLKNMFVSLSAAEKLDEYMLKVKCRSLENYFKIGYSQSVFSFNIHTSYEYFFTAQKYPAKPSDNSPPMYLFKNADKKYPLNFNKIFV